MKNMKLDIVGPDEIKQDSSKVLQWLAARKPSEIIIHFDLGGLACWGDYCQSSLVDD